MILSVIIPTLKRDEKTARAIDSVKRATEGIVDAELIVVEGLSPVGKARNEGLKRASGEYIAWVDADDEVTEDWGKEIKTALKDKPDVITFDAKLSGWEIRSDYVWGVNEKEATIERLKRDVYRDIVRPSALWLYVTKRELWEGLEFDESVRTAEDYLLFIKVIERIKSGKYIPKKLYRYIHNEGSLVNTQATGQMMRDFEVQRRQIESANLEQRGKMIWGAGLNMFWLMRRLKHSEEADYAQAFIRRHLRELLKETWCTGDFTLFDKFRCTARFLWGAIWKK